jgi:hypothetical protein
VTVRLSTRSTCASRRSPSEHTDGGPVPPCDRPRSAPNMWSSLDRRRPASSLASHWAAAEPNLPAQTGGHVRGCCDLGRRRPGAEATNTTVGLHAGAGAANMRPSWMLRRLRPALGWAGPQHLRCRMTVHTTMRSTIQQEHPKGLDLFNLVVSAPRSSRNSGK